MKLLTKEIKEKLPELYSQEGVPLEEQQIIVKFFTPDGGATWYAVEGSEQEDGNWIFFGYVDLGVGFPELGYFTLNELQGIRGVLGLPIERDKHFGYSHTLAEVMQKHEG